MKNLLFIAILTVILYAIPVSAAVTWKGCLIHMEVRTDVRMDLDATFEGNVPVTVSDQVSGLW